MLLHFWKCKTYIFQEQILFCQEQNLCLRRTKHVTVSSFREPFTVTSLRNEHYVNGKEQSKISSASSHFTFVSEVTGWIWSHGATWNNTFSQMVLNSGRIPDLWREPVNQVLTSLECCIAIKLLPRHMDTIVCFAIETIRITKLDQDNKQTKNTQGVDVLHQMQSVGPCHCSFSPIHWPNYQEICPLDGQPPIWASMKRRTRIKAHGGLEIFFFSHNWGLARKM